ncbi:hypothetical protein [Argonema antarcticum]|uniref:hypothetical protein n=1 Tax=Argonema antarcticum TaxID=2942763 RepID=UPI002012A913|nr:hypothetical protein [Argonema antarcticum]MCL1469731.1 hypothetical protein [Argonema antarcticum A004/B2]
MKSSLPSSQTETINPLSNPESEIKSTEFSVNSKLIKTKLFPVIEFAIATIADLIFPGLGILLDVCFLIWHLLENEEE